jgi:D-specific alpha-keto acid dehydrogenase
MGAALPDGGRKHQGGKKRMSNIGITVYGCERDEADAFRRLSPRFGVAPAIISDAVSEANANRVHGNPCVSVSHKSEVSESVIAALRNAGVRYISTRSAGRDHIDTDAAERMGVAVGSAAYSPGGVADYTLMLTLMAVRGAKSVARSVERHDFRLTGVRGRELRDMTVGVLGTGCIGKAVIQRLRGFGCRVLAHDHSRKTTADYVPLDRLLRDSDVVTLHVPLTAETRHIIGQEQIDGIKKGAFLVNTGRGALVDTAALAEALENGKLGGAALDVLEGEEGIFYMDYSEKTVGHRCLLKLQSMPNVIITPHMAYYTERALRETVLETIRNCLDFQRGLANGQN